MRTIKILGKNNIKKILFFRGELMKTKRKRLPKSAEASLWYVGASLISRGSAFVFTPFLTRMLSPSEYGIYALYSSWLGIFTVIETLELSGVYVFRRLSEKDCSVSTVVSELCLIQFILSASVALGYIIFSRQINRASGLGTTLTLLLIFEVLCTSLGGIYAGVCRFEYRYRTAALLTALSGLLKPMLSVLLLIVFPSLGIMRAYASAAVSVIGAIPAIVFIIKNGAGRPRIRRMLKTPVTLIRMLPHYIAVSVISHADKIMIFRILGEGAVGKYSVAYSAGVIPSMLTGALISSLSPSVIRKMKGGEGASVRALFKRIFPLLSLFVICFLSLLPEFYKICADADMRDGISAVYPISVSVLLLFPSAIYTPLIFDTGAAFGVLLAAAGSASAFLLSSFFLSSLLGFSGGGISLNVGYLILFLSYARLYKRANGEDVIEVKHTLLTLTALSLSSILLYFLRGVLISRLLILLAALLLILRYSLSILESCGIKINFPSKKAVDQGSV